jgi:hypothetical protein
MNWRRTPRRWVAVVGIVGLAGALSAIGLSSAATTVTINQSKGLSPSKLPKQRYVPASLNVVVDSNWAQGETPVAVTDTVLDFDDDGKITTRGLPVCRANLAALTAQQARQQCASSRIGQGSARAIPPGFTEEVPAVVSAFNGPPRGGNYTILLHSDIRPALPISLVLTGTIDPNGATGGDFGARLHVPVDVPPGTVLTRFVTTVKRTWRNRGRTVSYITGRCKDANKTLNIKGRFELAPNSTGTPTVQTPTATQRCTVRR